MSDEEKALISELFTKMEVYMNSHPEEQRYEVALQIGFAVIGIISVIGGLSIEEMRSLNRLDPIGDEIMEQIAGVVNWRLNSDMGGELVIPCIRDAYLQFSRKYPTCDRW